MDPIDLKSLLAEDEGPAFEVSLEHGSSELFFICDHASCRLPRALDDLGLSSQDIQRHIGWDIGAAAVTLQLSQMLDATAVLQKFSRLVIDCNRPPQSLDSIARISENIPIPGNQAVSLQDQARRQREIFEPYHACIRKILDERARQGRRTLLVAMHSFTPVYLGVVRPWHAGVLYNRDSRFARALADRLKSDPSLTIGDNQPYELSDDSDYSIPEHAERRGLPYVELEIRQDLIAGDEGQRAWAKRLAVELPAVAASLSS